MRPGDRITALNGTAIWTFGDLQYVYDKVDRKATHLQIAVDRGGESALLEIALPPRWWWTDLRFRQSSVEPRTHFEDRPLTDDEKRKFGLKPEGFASQVKYVADLAKVMKTHDLRVGDIICGVDGVEVDDLADTADLFIKLRKTPGDTAILDVLRDGKRTRMPLKTFRMNFRQ
jgi:S1-C subfamily serine protease